MEIESEWALHGSGNEASVIWISSNAMNTPHGGVSGAPLDKEASSNHPRQLVATQAKASEAMQEDVPGDSFSNVDIESLPFEILLLIFDLCSARDVTCCGMTSRRMREVCASDAIWKRLCAKDYGLSCASPNEEQKRKNSIEDRIAQEEAAATTTKTSSSQGEMVNDADDTSPTQREMEIDSPCFSHSEEQGGVWRGYYRQILESHLHTGDVLYYKGVLTDGGCDGTEERERMSIEVNGSQTKTGDITHEANTSTLSQCTQSDTRSADICCTSRYWCDNMFAPTHWDSYCSQASFNVHCFAFLQNDAARVDECTKHFRLYIIERTKKAALAMFGDTVELGLWSTAELELFMSELWGVYLDGHEIGKLLFVDLKQEQVPNEVRKVRKIVEMIETRWQGSPSNARLHALNGNMQILEMKGVTSPVSIKSLAQNFLLKDHLEINMSIVSSIYISRIGQFSCPVSCGVIFLGCATSPEQTKTMNLIEATKCQQCSVLQSMTSLSEVIQASKNGGLPEINYKGSQDGGEYAEFCESTNVTGSHLLDLRPVIWFKFISKREAHERAAAGGLSRNRTEMWDQMRIDLRRKYAGNVVCCKLISHENLMHEWDDTHDCPNIDINAVWLYGRKLTMKMV